MCNKSQGFYGDQPEPVAPTDEEILTTLKAAIVAFPPGHPEAKPLSADEYEVELEIRKARAVLATIKPVPVSERPWERPGWLDEEGCCWAIGGRGNWIYVHVIGRNWSNPIYTHLLPHWALPVPAGEGAS
jgi:hypothetical protein